MINAVHPDAPLSSLTDVQLLYLVDLPILISDFLFELHAEIKRREIVDKSVILKSVRQSFELARRRELELELLAMDDELPTGTQQVRENIERLRVSLKNHKYPPLVQFFLSELLLDHRWLILFPESISSFSVKKIDVARFCRKIVDLVNDSPQPLTLAQRQVLEFAEEVERTLTDGGKPILDAKENIVNLSVPVKAVQSPAGSKSWQDTLKQIRHGRLHPDVKKINHLQGSGDWADASPLKMLGYSVNSKDGLPEKERQELLRDFCELADLPKNLPVAYTRPWSDPNTNARILRTAKHLGFVRRNFEKQDSVLYARAIECWRKDFEFLEKLYGSRLTRSEWEQARKGM